MSLITHLHARVLDIASVYSVASYAALCVIVGFVSLLSPTMQLDKQLIYCKADSRQTQELPGTVRVCFVFVKVLGGFVVVVFNWPFRLEQFPFLCVTCSNFVCLQVSPRLTFSLSLTPNTSECFQDRKYCRWHMKLSLLDCIQK